MISEKRNEGIKVDLFNHNNKWVQVIAGCGDSRSRLYVSYIIFVLFIDVYSLSAALWAAYLVTPHKVLTVLAFHAVFSATYCTLLILSKLFSERTLKETNRMIISGIYNYENEEIDENQSNMKKEMDAEIRKACDLVAIVFGSGFISNMILFPLIQLMIHDGSYEDSILNPYLPPFFFHFPFNTRNVRGYCLAYTILIVCVGILYCQVISAILFFITCAFHLKGQLEILNYSIKNLHSRAISKLKSTMIIKDNSHEFSTEKEDFQTCVYSCFRNNVGHHHSLLRFLGYMAPYTGACLMDCYIMIALIYASLFYMILQKLPPGFLLNFIEMLLSEQSALFLVCYLGERITEEHGKLLENIYGLDWVRNNKKVTDGFRIMMTYTIRPMYLKSLLINMSASLKSYGDFMMTMYQIVNLVRQSGVVE